MRSSENQLPGEKYVRILEKQKIMLNLYNQTLEIRLYLNESNEFFYRGCFEYEKLSSLFQNMFNSIEEIFTEFKAIKEELFSFTHRNELIYSVPLAAKKLELVFQLSPVPLNREEELILDNQVLYRIKGDYELILKEKDREILELKEQVSQYKQTIQNYIIKKREKPVKPVQNIPNTPSIPKPIDIDSFDHGNSSKSESPNSRNNIFHKQHIEKETLKRGSNGLWELPSAKYFKNNEGKLQKLRKFTYNQFNFFMSEEAKNLNDFQYKDNRLKLLETHCENGYFSMIPSSTIDQKSATVLGIRLIKESERSIHLGIKCLSGEQEDIEAEFVTNCIVYDLKSGVVYTQEKGQVMTDKLIPIRPSQTLHVTINPSHQVISWFHNEILVKQFSMNEIFTSSTLIPFIEMSIEGEEIQFL